MWFSAKIDNVTGIYLATSADASKWVFDSVPVLRVGPSGAWDDYAVYGPNVIWNGSIFLMYYSGTGANAFREIGVAFSKDGYNWTKYSDNPIITPGPGYYDSWWTRFGSVLDDSGVYKMWYTGHTLTNTSQPWYAAIDYATSSDGIHWTKYAENPVYGRTQWLTSHSLPFFEHPSVLKINGTYVMVSDDSHQISYLTSPDGINWTPSGTTLIAPDGIPNWDTNETLYPSALLNGSKILVSYTGFDGPLPDKPELGMVWIGSATCNIAIPNSARYLQSATTTTSAPSSAETSGETSASPPQKGFDDPLSAISKMGGFAILVSVGVVVMAIAIGILLAKSRVNDARRVRQLD